MTYAGLHSIPRQTLANWRYKDKLAIAVRRRQAIQSINDAAKPILAPSGGEYCPTDPAFLNKSFVLLEPPAGIEPATC